MVSLKNILFVLIFVGLLSVTGCYAGVQESPSLVDSFVVANDISKARADIESSGGYVRHIFFDDKILIGKMPSDLKSDYIEEIYYYDSSVPSEYSVEFNAWKSVLDWNELSVAEKSLGMPKDAQPLVGEVEYSINVKDIKQPVVDKSLPLGASYIDTSLYMAGDVLVTVILPESSVNSPNTENWNVTEISTVHSEIMNAMNWWATKNPDADLTFSYSFKDSVPIDYEPITMATSGTARCTWINQTLVYLGATPMISPISLAGCNNQIYEYTNIQRDAMDSDWSFLIFIADASNDVNGLFLDLYNARTIATTYGDGIYLVGNYKNNIYGPENLDATIAHETGHIFSASDQYNSSAYPCNCSERRGYLNYLNQNCDNVCLINEPSIMKWPWTAFPQNQIDQYANGQIGWVDSDGDDILDIFDTETVVSLNQHLPDPDTNNSFNYTGDSIVSIVPAINPYYNDVSIDKVNNVLYRIKLNSGEWSTWSNSISEDGLFNEDNEVYFFAVGPLDWGNYIFQTKALSKFGSYTYDGNYGEDGVAIIGCIDSDNGQNYKIKATTTNFNGSYYGNQTDYCVNLRTLREYYCSGVNIVGVNNNCLYGCADGRCADKPAPKIPNIAVSSDGNL